MTEGESPMTGEELTAELKVLLRRAHDNGVGVNGGWECRNDSEYPDWDVVITEVQKPEASE
ncbi:hypothetical protein HWV23_15705 [Natronomonas halophila]|uniref:hypothetical protein n=1 Tax=Natronomonas halophila TaxID=2747817 RepID=UPI0015B69C85|nr:hypothetical protein [Natronomonas halophila]QLD87107.1 hypothetical protein HWV23_15705 [Natronomonas halophila]